ncbi:bifunctional demethylmenaquinone methyltransferase/2-methoxy-6-polyprenyl-1,4-benzoquinol methylase UbiE [Panacibacter ginsenosidivorans]|uniref:Demethylmenaquinone methyltransferase n=1 Tax=Panacibacter ginsenosidivorans TaxID=1813871 RepID=A0A5B8VCR3_9BACT|nr:bifunctional demethylmenaquinone methyltransferase/2-methoxy-6-polyprenyl-1,4-benzoquinol methylase UbiE [Panacibacter ginsenosidivorans]QEC68731.1 bifunctional demethylmenaquinone methyltransferase/2-methoxy-6-polyprenyl-1,4-benzoquinol methylase UbiE [Panacibacter ginsenosidivorans]
MTKFAHDDIVPDNTSSLDKKQQVAGMFDNIAKRYDFLNRLLSGGIDISWRKKAIAQLKELRPKTVLDVATGTADVALMTWKALKPEKIIGIDISDGMLALGRKKIEKQGLQNVIELFNGDSETIKYPDNSFDAVTVAFGVRNFQNLEQGLREMLRVLKPGGKLVILEFSKPKQTGFKGLYNFYMKSIAPTAGSMFANNKDAYQYLNDSVQAFPEREQFTEVMKQTGYKNIYFKPLTLGICCIYCGAK